jgi:hypothetical protein
METNNTPLMFYRYEITYLESSSTLYLRQYRLVKETPKGYWIEAYFEGFSPSGLKYWVSKTSKKRLAYPTKEEALNGFILRTQKRVNILFSLVKHCKNSLEIAKELQKEFKK